MTAPTGITISVGLPDALRPDASALYLEAFRQKIGPILGRDERANRFLSAVQQPSHAIIATSPDGTLLGMAGFHDEAGGFIGGGYRELANAYGHLGALWRAAALSLFERTVTDGQLLMDGIVVAPSHRGRGIGSLLLDAVETLAHERGKTTIRLDVVDTNPRARALYEKRGFAVKSTQRTPYFRPFFGFGGVTTMTNVV